jgi:hypothetical protein
MRNKRLGVVAGIVAVGLVVAGIVTMSIRGGFARAETPSHAGSGVPAYRHIFYIMMENHSYDEIIGNTGAPHINALATTYGLATNYWGVTHPSEPNYVASTAGSFYGIQDDNPYWTHQVSAPNLGSQLENAGLSWKTYQQSLPSVGFTGNNYPAGAVPGAKDKLYASKHNPFVNYLSLYGPVPTTSADGEFPANFTPNAAQQAELNKMVPDTQLATDLANGTVPNLSYIVPDQCHDMHGTTSCPNDAALIAAGDQYVSATVQAIMSSKTWQEGNNAIVVTWDENDFSPTNGSPGIASDGGQVPTIVIANHGPRGVTYSTPTNHYALMLTIEDAFHLGCLQNSCPATGNIQPMTPLFTVGGN